MRPLLAHHPDVGGLAAALHGKRGGVAGQADAGEAARHHRPALAGAHQIDAQRRRPRLQPAIFIDRRGRQRHRFLADECGAVGGETRDQRCLSSGVERGAEHGRLLVLERKPGRQRRADHHAVDVVDDVPALLRLAAPPRGDVGQQQFLAAQRTAKLRQEGEEGAGLENAGAERIDQRHRAVAQRLGEAGRADLRLRVELERIGENGVHAPPQHADRLQAGDRAHHQPCRRRR